MTIPPLQAEQLFNIGGLPITNAYINSSLALLLFIAAAFLIRFNLKEIPGKFQNAVEALLEFLLGYFDQVTHDRAKSRRFLPLVGTLFFFILASNWMSLIPGTGSIGLWLPHKGEIELIPLLRPAMSDLNLTLAMAALSVIASHLFGLFTLGAFVHLNKFIQLGTLWKAVKTLNPVKILVACVELVVGFIELFSEIAKVVSLSLRLFGNIFAGEVLLTVISGLFAFAMPLPFMALELIVGIVQATVFSMLTLVYLTVATTHPHENEGEAAHA
ncbi:F0F1 ATP synthase subunit A [Patescibacteria group bacterium]|nr:F0F1 ATP synthase subunit A [Patescibacteria group bacterium]MBU1034197.1 F0F1 ATP synthase subunit A [Patescibacteria group bacterium]MBU1629672.1 F0F1 ATP synthase subunit A [Patescibacteria group bacterium]MBU1907912.1 F0F1 ATP synthase subunit A [Patescibacteria group bacterium]